MKEGTNKGQEQGRQERNKHNRHADCPSSMWQFTIGLYLKLILEAKWISLTRTCVFFVLSNFSLHTWVLGSRRCVGFSLCILPVQIYWWEYYFAVYFPFYQPNNLKTACLAMMVSTRKRTTWSKPYRWWKNQYNLGIEDSSCLGDSHPPQNFIIFTKSFRNISLLY